MNNIPIVFIINKKFLPPAYVAIKSLVDKALDSTVYNIIVLYQGRIDRDADSLLKIVLNKRHTMAITDISGLEMNTPKISKGWPAVIYARLYLDSVLKEYDKIIYSDTDVLFLDDLSQVYMEDMTTYEWGGVAAEKNDSRAIMHQFYADNKHSYIFWSGFMLMNLKEMRANRWEERCNENINKYKDRLYMPDLEIMNLTAINIKRLPLRYVYLQALYDTADISAVKEWEFLSEIYTKQMLLKEKQEAKIIHFAGKSGESRIAKPWLRLKPPEYYVVYLNRLPPRLRRQNNFRRFIKNGVELIKIVLEKLHCNI